MIPLTRASLGVPRDVQRDTEFRARCMIHEDMRVSGYQRIRGQGTGVSEDQVAAVIRSPGVLVV